MVHKGHVIEAFASCNRSVCYSRRVLFRYGSEIREQGEEPAVKANVRVEAVMSAGEYKERVWRRQIDKLSFEGGTDNLRRFREKVMEAEQTTEKERLAEARTGCVATAAQKLLNRQINYNMTSVLNGRMERMSGDEWAPFMSRDRYGRIYNPAHALGGVGEMFRGLLSYGDQMFQFRAWREMDGTYGMLEMKKFRAYKKALDYYLLNS